MALEAHLSNFIIHETISAAPQQHPYTISHPTKTMANGLHNSHFNGFDMFINSGNMERDGSNLAVQSRRKRKRRSRVCRNREEAETQRMTHITVERNRRKLMNEHLAVLRSLMPESYVQRSDQASIVGGAIDFVKELEQLLQSLEAQSRVQLQHQTQRGEKYADSSSRDLFAPPFSQFFTHPQFMWAQVSAESPNQNRRAVADIEVAMIETHANVRILSMRRPKQIIRILTGFQALHLTILHLNVTTLDPFVLYSLSAKVEEGCHLNSADDIAGAVHHMLTIIADEIAPPQPAQNYQSALISEG